VEALDAGATESLASYHGFSHFIKPDMLSNIYSFVDFWMQEICRYQQVGKDLSLSHKDIKGDHALHAYRKYLTLYAGLDLSAAERSYEHLANLRKVRNYFMHSGGHVPKEKEQELSAINGITVFASLIAVDQNFVWASLDHANRFLRAAAEA